MQASLQQPSSQSMPLQGLPPWGPHTRLPQRSSKKGDLVSPARVSTDSKLSKAYSRDQMANHHLISKYLLPQRTMGKAKRIHFIFLEPWLPKWTRGSQCWLQQCCLLWARFVKVTYFAWCTYLLKSHSPIWADCLMCVKWTWSLWLQSHKISGSEKTSKRFLSLFLKSTPICYQPNPSWVKYIVLISTCCALWKLNKYLLMVVPMMN